MKTVYPLCLLAVPCALLPAAAPPAGPSPAEIARLTEQLGDDDFDTREAATERLKQIGEPALALSAFAREEAQKKDEGKGKPKAPVYKTPQECFDAGAVIFVWATAIPPPARPQGAFGVSWRLVGANPVAVAATNRPHRCAGLRRTARLPSSRRSA